MRIGMILPGSFPPDIRVEKEVETLNSEHQLSLLCLRRGKQPHHEHWHGMEVHREFSDLQRWWSQWTLMARCHSSAWATAIDRFATQINVDALHVHDLPLLGAALKVAEEKGIPVVADLHENYPAMLEQSLNAPLTRIESLGGLASRLSVSVDRWRAYERAVVPQAHRVITVIEEARDRIIDLGVSPANVSVVGNYATLDSIEDSAPQTRSNSASEQQKIRFVYAGGFGPTRDLFTLLDAVRSLPEAQLKTIEVKLIGGVGRDLAQLKQYAAELNIEDHVTLLPWLPRDEAEQLMCDADVGLVPHVKSAHTDATVPHKLFQYMWRKLPVIVSNCSPLERIVAEADCGLVYPSGDSQSLAARMSELAQMTDRQETLGENGHESVARQFNWNAAGESLLATYRNLEQIP